MYKIEITEVVAGQVYAVRVIDEKSGKVVIDYEISATSADDAEQFVIESFKKAFKKD
ncbi:TPA: hypothetical protein ACG0DS_002043 [Enterobacter sichuanensis]